MTIIQKGATDVISNGLAIPDALKSSPNDNGDALFSDVLGGLKRVGGQGDILSGSTGVLMAWGSEWVKGAYEFVLLLGISAQSAWADASRRHVGHKPPTEEGLKECVPLLAAYGASTFNRTVSRRGYEKKGRSMVTGDLVDLVGPVYEELFGSAQSNDENARL